MVIVVLALEVLICVCLQNNFKYWAKQEEYESLELHGMYVC